MAYESRLSIIIDSLTGERRLRSLQGQMNATERAGNSLRTVALAASGALAGLGAGMSLVGAIQTIGDFEQEMKTLQSVTRASSQDMAKFSKQARELGATTRYGANQAAQAQKFLAQAGLDVNQVLSATPGVLQLAQAGMMDLGSAADLATDIMAQMGLQVSDLSRINDVLVKTSQSATTDVRQLGEAFSYAGPIAKSFGLSLEDTGAALGVISSAGIKASRAGTGLLGILRQLANPTKESAEALTSYGISLSEVDVSARGFAPVLKTLSEANISAADTFTIFGSEAGSAAEALLDGRDAYTDLASDLDRVNGTAKDAAAIMSDSLNNALLGLQSALAEAALQGGEEGLAGAFRNLIDYSTGVIQVFNGLEEEWAQANGKGQEFLATVREIAGEFQEFATQFNLVAQDIVKSFGEANTYVTNTLEGWDLLGEETVESLSEGFRNLPANIKAMVEMGTVEMLVLVDKAKAYGEAIDKYLNPVNWFGDNWDMIGQTLDQQLAFVDQIRLDSITDILADREKLVNAFEIEQDVERQAKAIANLEENALSFMASMEDVGNQTDDTNDRTRTLTETTREAQEASGDFGDELERLRRELDPAYSAQRRLSQQTDLLTQGLQSGALTLDEYLSLWDSAAQVYGDATTSTKELGDVTDETLDEMGVLWERTMERMDDAGVDMWRSFIDGTENAFDSFKNIALDTLAEVIHAFTTRKITASLGLSVAGTGTAAAGQGGMGIGDLASMGSSLMNGGGQLVGNAWNAFQGTGSTYGGMFGSELVATGNGGFTAGLNSIANSSMFANAALGIGGGIAGGYLGTTVGESLFGKQANSNYGAMGGAMLGQALIPIPGLGAAIGGFAGGALDSLFGSGRSSYGQIGSESEAFGQAGGFSARDVYGDAGRYDGMLQQSALGTIGVTRKQKTDDDALVDMVSAFVEIDNTLASVMTGAQLEQTREALDGWRSSKTKNIGGIVDERLSAVVAATDSIFADALAALDGERLVTGLVGGLQIENVGSAMAEAVAADMNAEFRAALGSGSDLEAATQAILSSAQAVSLLGDSVDRLGLQFDATASGALAAAGSLAEMVGGVQNLSALQGQYYQAFFSEAEQYQLLQADLAEQLTDMGYALPDAADGFRDLIEAQNLMTEAGREQYATLLQLVPAMDQYLDGMDQQQAQFEQLGNWLDDLLLSDQSTLDPSERLQESQSQYASLLVQAENGDTDAMGQLGNVAQQYLSEAAGYYGQASGQYGSIFDEILDAARGLGVKVDGSHASGLWSVPRDGYVAKLHRDEMVAPAPVAQQFRAMASGPGQAEMLRTMQAMHQEMTQLRNEVRQLRGERGEDAARASRQRDSQLRTQESIDRNTRTPVAVT